MEDLSLSQACDLARWLFGEGAYCFTADNLGHNCGVFLLYDQPHPVQYTEGRFFGRDWASALELAGLATEIALPVERK